MLDLAKFLIIVNPQAMKERVCPHCKGTKRVMGLGMVKSDCIHCKGTGRVAVDAYVCDVCQREIAVSSATKVADEVVADIEVKKRRRKKIVEELQEAKDGGQENS